MTREEKEKLILEYIEKWPNCITQQLKFHQPELYKEICEYQEDKIPFNKYGIKAKIYWFLNRKTDFSKCKHCGKPLTQTKKYRMLSGLNSSYCSSKCRSANTPDINKDEIKIERTFEEKKIILENLIKKTQGYIRPLKYQYPDIYYEVANYCEDKIPLEKYPFSVKTYWYLNQLKDYPKCKACGKDLTTKHYYGLTGPKSIFCSKLCANNYNKKTIVENEHIFFAKRYYERLTNNDYATLIYDKDKFINDVIKSHGIRNFIEQNKMLKWKCHKCQNIVYGPINLNYFVDTNKYFRCMNCYPLEYTYISQAEKDIVEFIKSFYKGSIITSSQQIISPYQLDIYIPEKKLAIEFNGMYWHSEESGKDKFYHKMKSDLCDDQNIKLIHIFEDDWNQKQVIIKSKLKSEFGIHDCDINDYKIKKISNKNARLFYQINSLNYKENICNVNLGIFNNSELIACYSFYDNELICFSNKIGYFINNGFSNILKYFEKNYKSKNLLCKLDRCWCNKNELENLGFKLIEKSEPNLINNDLFIIYDCGNYILRKDY